MMFLGEGLDQYKHAHDNTEPGTWTTEISYVPFIFPISSIIVPCLKKGAKMFDKQYTHVQYSR